MSPEPLILLVEDKEDDVLLVQKAFQKGGIHNQLFVVRSGDEAINYLSGTGRFALRDSYPLPALILLDLQLPGADGFEVLRWIKTQRGLSKIRVLVLTASDHIRDMTMAYELGAASFLVKPSDFEDTVTMAKTIRDYWLRTNTFVAQPPPSLAQPPPEMPPGNGTPETAGPPP